MNNFYEFPEAEKKGVYRAIYERRDVRSHFRADAVPDEILARLLRAAHHAPSVGLMQPWRFVVIRELETRRNVHAIFARANAEAAGELRDAGRRAQYLNLKLAGILDAPINLCIVCDSASERGHGLGRRTMPETAAYSTVCAVQNLWLAARAEGLGVGWVSILNVDELRTALGIPAAVLPVAYLCVGYVTEFATQPELQSKGWEQRAPLGDLIFFDRYGAADPDRAADLLSS
jgi:5,6-dimethylbenzimidazole synthase